MTVVFYGVLYDISPAWEVLSGSLKSLLYQRLSALWRVEKDPTAVLCLIGSLKNQSCLTNAVPAITSYKR